MLSYDKPFSLICQWDIVTYSFWSIQEYEYLSELSDKTVVMIPFSQVHEKWYDYKGEKMPLIALEVSSQKTMSKQECLSSIQDAILSFSLEEASSRDGFVVLDNNISSNFSDEAYTKVVADVIEKEIKQWWEGPNFVISRQFTTKIQDFQTENLTKIFHDLLLWEEHAHMTFLFFDGEKAFVWATPEAHLRIKDGRAMMNPISWTLPKRHISQFDSFLQDQKEINELFQVTDEEIKMMSVMCSEGWEVQWPFFKEMNSVIHTEYYLEWKLSVSLVDAIRTSLFAATLVWAPVKNACRLIKKYEPTSRRYYWWCIWVIDGEEFDSGIIIRTAEIDMSWHVVLQVWASLVEYSDPQKECEETHAKVWWFLNILLWKGTVFESTMPAFDPVLLQERNRYLSRFLLIPQKASLKKNKKIILLDNGDDFVYTLSHMCQRHGYETDILVMDDISSVKSDIIKITGETDNTNNTIVLVWPGPWDPRTMKQKQKLVQSMIELHIPLIWVCLGHQLISHVLWYTVKQREIITQGSANTITIDCFDYRMWYYNSFAVFPDTLSWKSKNNFVEVTNHMWEIDVLRTDKIETMQFHPESIFSEYWFTYLWSVLERVLR